MSKKKKNPAPPAAEPTPTVEAKPIESTEIKLPPRDSESGRGAVLIKSGLDEESRPVSPPKTEEQAPPPKISIVELVKGIDENKLKMAEGLGIPIKGILQWMYVMENTVVALSQGMEQLGVNLKPLADQAKAIQEAKQAQPSGSSSPLGGMITPNVIEKALDKFLGGAPSGEDQFYGLFKEQVIKAGLSSMTSDQEIGRAVKQRIVSELSAKIISGALGGKEGA